MRLQNRYDLLVLALILFYGLIALKRSKETNAVIQTFEQLCVQKNILTLI